MKTCTGSPATDISYLQGCTDNDLLEGMRHHADPKWWKRPDIRSVNQAYLRRWGAYLRREARRRGLL